MLFERQNSMKFNNNFNLGMTTPLNTSKNVDNKIKNNIKINTMNYRRGLTKIKLSKNILYLNFIKTLLIKILTNKRYRNIKPRL